MVFRQDVMHGVPPADGAGLLVVGRRDDDQVVDEGKILADCLGEEIAVADADSNDFDSQSRRPSDQEETHDLGDRKPDGEPEELAPGGGEPRAE